MTTTELSTTLTSGGTVTVIIDVDWLKLSIDEYTFIRDLAEHLVSYATKIEPTAAPAKDVAPASRPARPATSPNRSTATTSQSRTYDYAVVARVAIAAQKAGGPTARAVAQHLNVNENTARLLIAAARDKGHDIPKMSKGGRPASNVTPLRPPTPPVTADNHPSRFTPADAIGELEQNR